VHCLARVGDEFFHEEVLRALGEYLSGTTDEVSENHVLCLRIGTMLIEISVGESVLAYELFGPNHIDTEERDVEPHCVGISRVQRKECKVARGTHGVHESDNAAGVVTHRRSTDSCLAGLFLAARCTSQSFGHRRCVEQPLLGSELIVGIAGAWDAHRDGERAVIQHQDRPNARLAPRQHGCVTLTVSTPKNALCARPACREHLRGRRRERSHHRAATSPVLRAIEEIGLSDRNRLARTPTPTIGSGRLACVADTPLRQRATHQVLLYVLTRRAGLTGSTQIPFGVTATTVRGSTESTRSICSLREFNRYAQ